MNEHGGEFFCDLVWIVNLFGIGRLTANVIVVFVFGSCVFIFDGNVKCVLCRSHGMEGFFGMAAVE